jgi:lysophospholipase L1-like esterase
MKLRYFTALFMISFLSLDAQTSSPVPTPPTAAPIQIMPMGASIVWGLGVAGGFRERLEFLLHEKGIAFEFVGKINNTEKGTTTLQDKHCEGYSGHVINQGQPGGSGVGKGGNFGWGGLYDKLVEKKSLESPVKVDYVLLLIGTNDISFNVSDANGNILDRLKGLLKFIHEKQPSAHVIVSTLTPMTGKPNRKTEGILAYNTSLLDAATGVSTLPNTSTVDMYAAFLRPDGTVNKDYFGPKDAVHPNKAGYDHMADVWFAALLAQIEKNKTPQP